MSFWFRPAELLNWSHYDREKSNWKFFIKVLPPPKNFKIRLGGNTFILILILQNISIYRLRVIPSFWYWFFQTL